VKRAGIVFVLVLVLALVLDKPGKRTTEGDYEDDYGDEDDASRTAPS
jgi:hypothetical protein